MTPILSAAFAMALPACAAPLHAQVEDEGGGTRRGPLLMCSVQGAGFHATYVRLGNQGEGLMYEPNAPGAKARIAIVFTHPANNNFSASIGPEMALYENVAEHGPSACDGPEKVGPCRTCC